MPAADNNRIKAQYTAYRRGLVLGLTMAEVSILIVFVLLLLVGFVEVSRERQSQAMIDHVTVGTDRLRELEDAESLLTSLKRELRVAPDAPVEEIQKLVRVVQEAVASKDGQAALVQGQKALDDIRRARDEIVKVGNAGVQEGAMEIATRVEQQSFRIANQEGQLQHYEKKLAEVGQGKGERPCWVQPGGKIDYLYDIALTSTGIRMRECSHPERAAERAQLPMPAVDPQEVLSEAEFLARTSRLFDYSRENSCRFFVVVYDTTASDEKVLYKSLLRAVEGHFFKRYDDGPVPF